MIPTQLVTRVAQLFKLLPFQPNASASFARGGKLQTLLQALETDPDFAGMGVAVVDLTRAPGRIDYAGLRDRNQLYAASLVKIAVMFAAFRLRQSVIDAEGIIAAKDRKDLFAKLTALWKKEVATRVSKRHSDFPLFSKIFTPDGELDFNDDFRTQLKDMIQMSNNEAAAECIHRLGYQYLNGALAIAGFFDSVGLWLGGDYVSGKEFDRKGYKDFVEIPVHPDANRKVHDPRRLTTQGATAEAVAKFLTLVETDQLVNAKASREMKELMLGQRLRSPFKDELDTTYPGQTKVYGKIGIGYGVGDDCAVVVRKAVVRDEPKVLKKIKYVAVGLRDAGHALRRLILELDHCVVQNNAP